MSCGVSSVEVVVKISCMYDRLPLLKSTIAAINMARASAAVRKVQQTSVDILFLSGMGSSSAERIV